MEGTIDRLLQQAYLFDDPRAYRAGVQDAVQALEDLLGAAVGEDRVHLVLADDPVHLIDERTEQRPA